MGETTKKKRILKMPHPLVLIWEITVVAMILTWLIPAGAFETESVDGVTKVIAGTYHMVEKTPVGPFLMVRSMIEGCQKGIKMMLVVLMVSGAVRMLTVSGTFSTAFGKLAANKKLPRKLIAFVCMLFMSVAGCGGIISSSTVAYLPIGIVLAASLGYDAFTGVLIIFMGAYSGFNVGWANISTIGTAQTLAELPIFSGFSVRFILWILNFLLTVAFTFAYINKIEKDPTKSLNYHEGMEVSQYMGISSLEGGQKGDNSQPLTWRHKLSLAGFLGIFATVLIGAAKFGWTVDYTATCFLILAVFVGLVNGYGLDGTAKYFIEGCKGALGAAFLIGFAQGISVVLTKGNILNTVVYWLSEPLAAIGPVLAPSFMFIANTIINFFIGSGSGQAAVVMPLMTPLSDLLGITRQVACQAFQFGDGLSNCLYPNGTTMANLEIAKVDYFRYLKWFVPLMVCQSVVAMGSLTVLQVIGWTGI